MSKRNRFKFICGDCGAATFFTAAERTSRFLPRCSACGSARLEPSRASEARTRLPMAEDERREARILRDVEMGKNT